MRWPWSRPERIEPTELLRFVRTMPGEMAEMDIAKALKDLADRPGWKVLKQAFMHQFLKSIDVMGDDRKNTDLRAGMARAFALSVKILDSTENIDLQQLERDIERDRQQREDQEGT